MWKGKAKFERRVAYRENDGDFAAPPHDDGEVETHFQPGEGFVDYEVKDVGRRDECWLRGS